MQPSSVKLEFAGETVTLRIADAAAGPVECAQKLFKRAAKQRRAQERVTPLMEAAEAQLTYVREVDESLQELGQCAPCLARHCRAAALENICCACSSSVSATTCLRMPLTCAAGTSK